MIINTGIMLEHLTNGAIPIGVHRVVADRRPDGGALLGRAVLSPHAVDGAGAARVVRRRRSIRSSSRPSKPATCSTRCCTTSTWSKTPENESSRQCRRQERRARNQAKGGPGPRRVQRAVGPERDRRRGGCRRCGTGSGTPALTSIPSDVAVAFYGDLFRHDPAVGAPTDLDQIANDMGSGRPRAAGSGPGRARSDRQGGRTGHLRPHARPGRSVLRVRRDPSHGSRSSRVGHRRRHRGRGRPLDGDDRDLRGPVGPDRPARSPRDDRFAARRARSCRRSWSRNRRGFRRGCESWTNVAAAGDMACLNPHLATSFGELVIDLAIDNGHRAHDPEPYLNAAATGRAIAAALGPATPDRAETDPRDRHGHHARATVP